MSCDKENNDVLAPKYNMNAPVFNGRSGNPVVPSASDRKLDR